MPVIRCTDVVKSYNNESILKNINLSFESSKKYVIQGASGSGKSTLLYLIGGLDKCDSGDVRVGEISLKSLSDDDLSAFRNKNIGFVFQFHFLLPSMNLLDNILLPNQIAGGKKSDVYDFVLQLSKIIGVEGILGKYPYEVSGGEQQRINLIRALSMRPKILLCDEPTGNLDSKNSDLVVELLEHLTDKIKSTLIMVTHDKKIANRFQEKITIEDGLIIS